MSIKITSRGGKHNLMIIFIVIIYCLTTPNRVFLIIVRISVVSEELCVILEVFDW